MKVNFKRVATAALAVAMSLSLNVSAFAAEPMDNCSLTVKGKGLGGKTVYAIRMFTADVNVPEKGGENTFVNYKLEDNWIEFFKSDDMKSELEQAKVTIGNDAGDEDVKAAALEYMEWLAGEEHKEDWPDFADMAEAWFYENAYVTSDETPALKEGWSEILKFDIAGTDANKPDPGDVKDQVTFQNLVSGYYLIFPEAGSTGKDNRGTDAILYNIPRDASEENTIEIKSTFPTVDKTVDDGNNNTPGKEEESDFADDGSAQIGKVVDFSLTSAVPDMSKFTGDGATYVFQFTDKLSSGLTLADKDGAAITADNAITEEDVILTINDTPVATDKFTVISAAGAGADAGKTILTVKISNLLDKNLLGDSVAAVEGQEIVLTYKAIINENAATGTDPVTNEAQVDYSNDPNTNGMGHSTPDISKVYNYPIDIFKYYKTGEMENKLPGAKFVLSTNGNLGELTEGTYPSKKADLIPLVDVTAGGKTGQDYRVATSANEHGATYVIDSTKADENGKVTIDGLEAGTYYLYEITAPDTYNKLKEPVEIKIVVEPIVDNAATNDATLDKPVYIIDGEVNIAEDNAVKVENKQGIELPETGSIGTIGLTALGVVVVVAGLFAFPRKKKTRQD